MTVTAAPATLLAQTAAPVSAQTAVPTMQRTVPPGPTSPEPAAGQAASSAAPLPGFAGGASPFRSARVTETLRAADAALAQGDGGRAIELFEQAAGQEHAVDIEVGLVRSLMQAGHYRRALAFAAHTSGTHAEQTAGAALYAWLLAVGGQGAFARRLLADVAQRLPSDALVQDVTQRLQAGPATSAPLRFAPAGRVVENPPADAAVGIGIETGTGIPPGARGVASGVLIDNGRRALAPAAALDPESRVWVRDGLGRSVAARLERHHGPLGIAVLQLDSALPDAPVLGLPAGDAFPGAPAFGIDYATSADAAPAWPWLHSGVLGSVDVSSGTRRLGLGLPPGPRGGPVFDLSGRLVGVALAQPGKPDTLMPISVLRAELGEVLSAGPVLPSGPRMPMDEIYERGLRLAVQIVTAPPQPGDQARRQ